MSKTSAPKSRARSKSESLKPSLAIRLLACGIVGLISGVLIGRLVSWRFAPLAIWDVGALTYLIWTWLALHGRNAESTAAHASAESPGHAITDLGLLLASVVSLAGVG